MNLKDFLPGHKEEQEHLWAIVVEPGWIQAGIWRVEEEKARVVAMSPPFAWASDDELVKTADAALSACVSEIDEETKEPQRAVFGIATSWVEGGEIKKEHLATIKKICLSLSIKPCGFVVLSEALSHLIKSEEGVPLSACLIGLGKESLDVSLFKLGNLSGTTFVARSVNVGDDIIEGLARFESKEEYPSRIILYDGRESELEEVRQSIISISWEEEERVKFLHPPKVEIATPERKVLATALAGAIETFNVKSIAKDGVQSQETYTPKEAPPTTFRPKPESEGDFVVGRDVTAEPTGNAPSMRSWRLPKVSLPSLNAADVLSKVSKVPAGASDAVSSFLQFSTAKLATIAIGLFIALVLTSLVILFFPKAFVSVYVAGKNIAGDVALGIGQGGALDLDRNLLPGSSATITLSGQKTKETTGSKRVGEKARGQVKVQNGTVMAINLPAGTVLAAVTSDLTFTTSASSSVSAALSPTTPGTTTLDVVARDIGTEYNLTKDESFKVGNYPRAEVDAISLSDFTGGLSRQVSSVSGDDQEEVRKLLEEELATEAKGKVSSEVAKSGQPGSLSCKSSCFLIEESIDYKPKSVTFSGKIGDEAGTIAVNEEVEISFLYVDYDDLLAIGEKSFQSLVPSGFVLTKSGIKTKFERQEEGDSNSFDVSFTTSVIPAIDTPKIKEKIVGKSPSVANQILSGSVPGFIRSEIRLSPKIPFVGLLPFRAENINLSFVPER